MLRLSLCAAFVLCSGPEPQRPRTSRGPTADEHLESAQGHEDLANDLASWPDPTQFESRFHDIRPFWEPEPGVWYYPIAFETTPKQMFDARVQNAQAAQIQSAFEVACANVAADRIRSSPLQRYGEGGTPLADGVAVILAPDAGSPDRVAEELRCHRAWAMLSRVPGMEDDPLDLPGLRVRMQDDPKGITLELRVTDPVLVPELQRRTARELEVAAARTRYRSAS